MINNGFFFSWQAPGGDSSQTKRSTNNVRRPERRPHTALIGGAAANAIKEAESNGADFNALAAATTQGGDAEERSDEGRRAQTRRGGAGGDGGVTRSKATRGHRRPRK